MFLKHRTEGASKWRSRVLVSMATTTTLAAGLSVTPAQAAGTFHIHNYKASGKCVGIAADGTAGDWSCTTNADQTWHWGDIVNDNASYHELVNGNGECLKGYSKGTGAFATYGCNPTLSQEGWTAVTGSYGFFLQNEGSNVILAVNGGSTANGATLIMWNATGSLDQYWSLY